MILILRLSIRNRDELREQMGILLFKLVDFSLLLLGLSGNRYEFPNREAVE